MTQLRLLVDAGELSALCVTGAALAAAGLLVVLAARRAFPPSSPRAGPDPGRPGSPVFSA